MRTTRSFSSMRTVIFWPSMPSLTVMPERSPSTDRPCASNPRVTRSLSELTPPPPSRARAASLQRPQRVLHAAPRAALLRAAQGLGEDRLLRAEAGERLPQLARVDRRARPAQ